MNEPFTIKMHRNTISKSIRLPTDQVHQLEELASEYDTALTDLVIQCI